MEDIFGRVVVHIPARQQVRLEGELSGVFDERLERLALGVRDLGPIGRARVLWILDRHRDFQDAALLGLLCQRLCRRSEAEHAIGHRGGSAEHACHSQEFAAIDFTGFDGLGHLADVVRDAIPVTPVKFHDELPLLAFRRLQFRIRPAMSKMRQTGTQTEMCNFEGEPVRANATNLTQNC
jgi:hypothetical protein